MESLSGQTPQPTPDEQRFRPEHPALRLLWDLPGLTLIGLARIYQFTLSPIIGRQCRFTPTCSNYFIGAVRKYGAVRGTWRGILRICRCHPFHPGGYDPP